MDLAQPAIRENTDQPEPIVRDVSVKAVTSNILASSYNLCTARSLQFQTILEKYVSSAYSELTYFTTASSQTLTVCVNM